MKDNKKNLNKKAADINVPAVPRERSSSDKPNTAFDDVSIKSTFGEDVNKGPYGNGVPPAVPTEAMHLAAVKKASKCLAVAYKIYGDNVSDEHLQKTAALMMDWQSDRLQQIFEKASSKDLQRIASKLDVKVAKFEKAAKFSLEAGSCKKSEDEDMPEEEEKGTDKLAALDALSDDELRQLMAEDFGDDEGDDEDMTEEPKAKKKASFDDLSLSGQPSRNKKASAANRDDDFFADSEYTGDINMNALEDPFSLDVAERPQGRKTASNNKFNKSLGNVTAKDINDLDVEQLSALWGSAPDISKLL